MIHAWIILPRTLFVSAFHDLTVKADCWRWSLRPPPPLVGVPTILVPSRPDWSNPSTTCPSDYYTFSLRTPPPPAPVAFGKRRTF